MKLVILISYIQIGKGKAGPKYMVQTNADGKTKVFIIVLFLVVGLRGVPLKVNYMLSVPMKSSPEVSI